MKRALFAVLAVALATPAVAAEDYLGTVSGTTSAVDFTATAGASLALQCSGPVRYAAGSAGSPPTAGSTSLRLSFTSDAPVPIQLSTTQDRISVINASSTSTSFSCVVYSQTTIATIATAIAAAKQCSVLTQTVTSVGVTEVAVPASGQSGRLSVEICVSAENAGSPKVKCLVDPGTGKPVMGVTEPGDVLQAGAVVCVTYAVTTSHPIKCVSDTAATAVTASECVSP